MSPQGRAPLDVLVLAAGRGTRMRSRRAKVLHDMAGRPLLQYVLEAARALRPERLTVVVGHQARAVRAAADGLADRFVLQDEPRGTGHAVLRAARALRREADVLILSGDVPLVRPRTLRALVAHHRRQGAALTVLTAELERPAGYGRIVRDGDGRVCTIVEERDATPEQRAIREVNTGIYVARVAALLGALRRLKPDNRQGEYYLTDALHELARQGALVCAVRHDDPEEVQGVNTRAELAQAARRLYARKAESLQNEGVTVLDPGRTWVDPRARIGRDTILYPGVILEGATVLGEGCVIYPGVRIVDSVLGKGVVVRDHTLIAQSRIADGARVGPFAHLRPGSELGREVHIGNFVELKMARLGRGAKANHLAYLGDAEVGAGSNIGAGTITCNYDGKRKHRTVLGRRVFIGSDTQLVAPVRVGDGAYVGAGSTVTQDVPAGALALSRSPQVNIRGWVARRKRKRARRAASSRTSRAAKSKP